MGRRIVPVKLLLAFALVAGACGDSDTTEPTEVTAPTGSAEPTQAATTRPSATPAATEVPTPTPTPVAGPPEIVPVADRLPADPAAPADAWVVGINDAGWGFHRQLEGNAVSSPVSIAMVFSLARAGASPEPRAALDRIFGFPSAGTHEAANAVDLALESASTGPTTLEVANRLFPDDGFSPLAPFLDTAARHYGATIQPVDTSDGAGAAAVINGWVADATRGLIPTIVEPDSVQDTDLVLVNTVYLKADWAIPFVPDLTIDDTFTTSDGSSVTAPFMHDYIPLSRRFVRLPDADAVELPYDGGELAMWVVVPHDVDGLSDVESGLEAGALSGLSQIAEEGFVEIALPKWEHTLPPTDLFEWLCPFEFCPGAGFDDISPGLEITAAIHSAKVIVDEKGTEAAAATALAFAESGPPPADLTVVADRPFLWAILHQDTGALLFVGRVVDPT